MCGVAGVGDFVEVAVDDPRGDCSCLGEEFLVARPRESERHALGGVQSWSEPFLGAGASTAQRPRQTPRIARAREALAFVTRQCGEHWLSEPFLKKRLGTDCLDVTREFVIPLTPFRTLGRVLDTPRGAEQDQSLDALGESQGDVQCDARAKGVPAE